MKNYKYIFFDLDRTLWDFETNTRETLDEIIQEFSLEKKIPDVDTFVRSYNYYNDRLWDDYRNGKVKKYFLRQERFRLLLNHFGINNKKLTEDVSRFYLNTCPVKEALIPYAREILEYLEGKYRMYIISNGFYDVQLTKLVNSGINKYFTKVFTSDRIGFAKPNARMFDYVVRSIHAHKDDCLMIGDDIKNDIEGASKAGIDQIYYSVLPQEVVKATYIIRDLKELYNIL